MDDEFEVLRDQIQQLPVAKRRQLFPVVEALSAHIEIRRSADSDVVSQQFADEFGALLQLHHAFSNEAFTKDKFEYALERVLVRTGRQAELAPTGNPGHDITVDGSPWSLKTQADKSIRPDVITISKFMELGRGQWETEADLAGLRDRMFQHMKSYERIFTLRCLTPASAKLRTYELVEIPQTLLLLAGQFPCKMSESSRQHPKPGYCKVYIDESLVYQLYFDGGTERKLQVQKLLVSKCVLHAQWDIFIG